MKVFILLLVLSCICFAQDTIYKTDGTEIKSKVIEITNDLIKYKKFSNLDGPSYTVSKTDVFMIVYQNGEREVFKKNEQPAKVEEPKPEYQAPTPVRETPATEIRYAPSTTPQETFTKTVFYIPIKFGVHSYTEEAFSKIYGACYMVGAGIGVWFPNHIAGELSVDLIYNRSTKVEMTGNIRDAEANLTAVPINLTTYFWFEFPEGKIVPYIGGGVTHISVTETVEFEARPYGSSTWTKQKLSESVDKWGFNLLGGVQIYFLDIELRYTKTDPNLGGISFMASFNLPLN
ncbi:MAG: hypothetical protein FD122_2450 [Stygiobacter sp.]|nr:MAG: hypothetical protein FD122_2450 [Stygiobacter sp.]KAF0216219.1 MAG: hypothetical protein FD178_1285 [Ignavibacteria bacterium]